MKILLVVFIMLSSFLIGSGVKQKIKNEYSFLVYLKNFVVFLKSNFNMFKVDIVSIIDEYIKFQDDKNGKYNAIFQKNNEIYIINYRAVCDNNSNEEDKHTIYTFLNAMGKSNYEFEDEKINSFLYFLQNKMKEYCDNIKEKGVLTEKIMLAVGLIISILVW